MKTKQCTKCKKVKPLSEFSKDKSRKDGLCPWCKVCQKNWREENKEEISERRRKYRNENKEKVSEHRRKYYDKNRDKLLKKARKYYDEHLEDRIEYAQEYYEKKRDRCLQRLYGITLREYDLMLELQEGGCAICGMTPEKNGKRLAVDHDHETGKVRELLCSRCNKTLGTLNDDPELCDLFKWYLQKHGK